MNTINEIIECVLKLGFVVGTAMYVLPWFLGYCLQGVLSTFKNLIKK